MKLVLQVLYPSILKLGHQFLKLMCEGVSDIIFFVDENKIPYLLLQESCMRLLQEKMPFVVFYSLRHCCTVKPVVVERVVFVVQSVEKIEPAI